MTGVRLSATLDAPEIRRGLDHLIRMGTQPAPLLTAIGEALREVTLTRFEIASDPDGTAWKPLSPAYAGIKKGPGILRGSAMSGGLQGSITYAVSAGAKEVAVGTNKVHGAIHQFGGVIKPKKPGGLLVFKTANGLAFARSVTIPARPYLGFGRQDQDAVMDVLDTFVAQATR